MRRSSKAFSRRDIIAFTLLGAFCVLLFSTLVLVQSAPQVTKRSFENKIPPQVPLKIKIKKEKEEKALDVNNKNWFRDIEIEITNTSDKPIYFLSIDVRMPDVTSERGVVMLFPLRYGRVEFYEHNTKPLPEDKPIAAKATYTFAFEEDNKVGWDAWRAKNQKNDPMTLEVTFNHLNFGDGTGFTSMSAIPFPFKNDPEQLSGCLKKPRPPNEWANRQ